MSLSQSHATNAPLQAESLFCQACSKSCTTFDAFLLSIKSMFLRCSACEVQLTGDGPWQLPDGGDDVELLFTPGHTKACLSH